MFISNLPILHRFSSACLSITMFNMVGRFFHHGFFYWLSKLLAPGILHFIFWMTKSDDDYSLLLIYLQLNKNLSILFIVVALSKGPPSFSSNILLHVVTCFAPTSALQYFHPGRVQLSMLHKVAWIGVSYDFTCFSFYGITMVIKWC